MRTTKKNLEFCDTIAEDAKYLKDIKDLDDYTPLASYAVNCMMTKDVLVAYTNFHTRWIIQWFSENPHLFEDHIIVKAIKAEYVD